jgi:tyrosyl-tRNA synthetase
MLVGRDLLEAYDKEPQVVITMPLLVGTDGVQKMSKSFGNYIGINESPDEIYGKVMSIPDEIMFSYYELLTDVPLSEIGDFKRGIEDRTTHPKDVKSHLAFNLVETYHSKEAAIKAAGNFEKVFKERQLPEEIPVFSFQVEKIGLLEVLINTGIAETKNEARRLILQGAVDLNGEKIRDVDYKINLKGKGPIILKAGKRKFVKLTKKDN